MWFEGIRWRMELFSGKKALDSHKAWYKGDGIYGDGAEFHLDYYNSYVIHPLLLQVLKIAVKYDSSFLPFWMRSGYALRVMPRFKNE